MTPRGGYILNIQALDLMVSEKNFFFLSFSHYKSVGANDPWGVASLGPWAWVGIHVGDH